MNQDPGEQPLESVLVWPPSAVQRPAQPADVQFRPIAAGHRLIVGGIELGFIVTIRELQLASGQPFGAAPVSADQVGGALQDTSLRSRRMPSRELTVEALGSRRRVSPLAWVRPCPIAQTDRIGLGDWPKWRGRWPCCERAIAAVRRSSDATRGQLGFGRGAQGRAAARLKATTGKSGRSATKFAQRAVSPSRPGQQQIIL